MLVIKYFSGLLLILMGSIDCLTTVVGTLYFGTQELNPLMQGIVSTNLPVFVILRMVATAFVGSVFIFAEKNLIKNTYIGFAFKIALDLLRLLGLTVTLFLLAVVLNNMIVILNAWI